MLFEKKVELLRIKKHKGRETKEFLNDVVNMAEGEAFEYLMGEVDFCGAKVGLSLRPMIPRPETAFWVMQAIEHIKNANPEFVLRILDLYSGSGNVGLALLTHFDEASVDFIEVDPKLKEQIEISIQRNNIKKTRTRVLTGDSFDGAQGTYHYIFAVPPYVPPQMKEEVMAELHAEDPLSFFDKEDGYFYHTEVLKNARQFLKDGGVLCLEFDITQREKIEAIAKDCGWETYSFLLDPYGHEFVIMCTKTQ
jgi:HemK-like putative methylase